MTDTFDKQINIGDTVVYMYQHYDGRWDSFHKGTVVGFTENFVKINIVDTDKDNYWAKKPIYVNGTYEWLKKPYILRQPHKIIVIK